jgi:hypothetical protein
MFLITFVTLLIFIFGFFAFLALGAAVDRRRTLRLESRMRSEVSVLVERMIDRPADAPALEFGCSFDGWPVFTLVFPTAEARSRLMEQETIREFASQLEKIVLGLSPRYSGFDGQKALSVTSVPEREALVHRLREVAQWHNHPDARGAIWIDKRPYIRQTYDPGAGGVLPAIMPLAFFTIARCGMSHLLGQP